MENELITYLHKNRPHCVFVSPHLDDAGFSAGALIAWLVRQNIPVSILNVFTESTPPPYTLSANAFLQQCSYSSAGQLFSDRRAEDLVIFSKLGVPVQNLGYIDALWRPLSHPSLVRRLAGKIIPECLNVYPTFRWHIAKGIIGPADQTLVSTVIQDIRSYAQENQNTVVFAPIGIGLHVDHIVTREACKGSGLNCIYWSDYPYNLYNQPNNDFLEDQNLFPVEFSESLDAKREIIYGYKSQLTAIFRDKKIQVNPDVFYLPKTMTV